jgi:hypothetical protein
MLIIREGDLEFPAVQGLKCFVGMDIDSDPYGFIDGDAVVYIHFYLDFIEECASVASSKPIGSDPSDRTILSHPPLRDAEDCGIRVWTVE